jgi:Arm domain-containing DNA-binding protein
MGEARDALTLTATSLSSVALSRTGRQLHARFCRSTTAALVPCEGIHDDAPALRICHGERLLAFDRFELCLRNVSVGVCDLESHDGRPLAIADRPLHMQLVCEALQAHGPCARRRGEAQRLRLWIQNPLDFLVIGDCSQRFVHRQGDSRPRIRAAPRNGPADELHLGIARADLVRRFECDLHGFKALKPDKSGKPYDMMDSVVPGFGVRVMGSGQRTFILRARFPGSRNPTRRALGGYGELTLERARARARDWIEFLSQGKDPAVEAACETGNAFSTVVEDYILSAAVGRRVFVKLWGTRPVTSITRKDVIAAIENIRDRGTPRKQRKDGGKRRQPSATPEMRRTLRT